MIPSDKKRRPPSVKEDRGRSGTERRTEKPPASGPKKKRAAHKNRIGRLLYGLFLLALLLLIGGYFLLNHRYFRIKYVRVEGGENITTEQVVREAGDLNQNIFLFSTANLEKKIMLMPGVRSVHIDKVLPNRLSITIEESYLIGRIGRGEQALLINQDGIVQPKQKDAQSGQADVPELTGFDPVPDVGEKISTDERVIQFLSLAVQSSMASDIEKIGFENRNNIDIIYKGITVHFGELNDLIDKLSKLEAVVADIEQKKIHAVEIIMNEGKNPIVVTGNE